MTTSDAIRIQIEEAFGPPSSLPELAQDLANAAALRSEKPVPADPIPYATMPLDSMVLLFGYYGYSLPWLTPSRLQRHVGALMCSGLLHGLQDSGGDIHRSYECLGFMLSPHNPPSVCAHLRTLWQPLTAQQRIAIAAYLVRTDAPRVSQQAWSRGLVHQAAAPEEWSALVWPKAPQADAQKVLEHLLSAFPVLSSDPWTQLSVPDALDGYLPFVQPDQLDRLLPAFSSFVLREPEHPAQPAVCSQLYSLLQPFDGSEGTPPLRRRLSFLTQSQRQALCGLVQRVFVGDDIHEIWIHAAALSGPDWLARLGRPEWDADYRRDAFLKSARGACAQAESPDPAGEDYASVAIRIEAAFDGVPAPAGDQRTLFEAENADSYFSQDVSNGRESHRGRWQDLPHDELRDCGSALAHLGPEGLRYYAPAIMMRILLWRETRNDGERREPYLYLFDSIGFMLSPSRRSYELRDYHWERYALFSQAQRHAIYEFMLLEERNSDAASAWARVVEHDLSGEAGHWFDVLWPPRERPDTALVIAQIRAAFGVVDPLRERDPDHESLSWVPPEHFANRFAHEAIFILQSKLDHQREDALAKAIRALRPYWGHEDQPQVRARLGVLSPPQRRAVSAFCDACVDSTAVRQMWRSACAREGEDWFEYLRASEEY